MLGREVGARSGQPVSVDFRDLCRPEPSGTRHASRCLPQQLDLVQDLLIL